VKLARISCIFFFLPCFFVALHQIKTSLWCQWFYCCIASDKDFIFYFLSFRKSWYFTVEFLFCKCIAWGQTKVKVGGCDDSRSYSLFYHHFWAF